jgi:hypothetical protein
MPLVGIGTPPQPPTRRLVCHLPPVSGGRGTHAGEKGVGRVPIPTRGIHYGTLYMYVLCDRGENNNTEMNKQLEPMSSNVVVAFRKSETKYNS